MALHHAELTTSTTTPPSTASAEPAREAESRVVAAVRVRRGARPFGRRQGECGHIVHVHESSKVAGRYCRGSQFGDKLRRIQAPLPANEAALARLHFQPPAGIEQGEGKSIPKQRGRSIGALLSGEQHALGIADLRRESAEPQNKFRDVADLIGREQLAILGRKRVPGRDEDLIGEPFPCDRPETVKLDARQGNLQRRLLNL